MSVSSKLSQKLDQVPGKAHVFVGSVALVGALLIGSSLLAWQSSHEQQRLASAHEQTLQILRSAHRIKLASLNILRGERGFLLSGRPADLAPYFAGRRDLSAYMDELDRTVGDTGGVGSISELRQAAGAFVTNVDQVVRLARSGQMSQARTSLRNSGTEGGLATIDETIDGIITRERTRLSDLRDHVDVVSRAMQNFIYLLSAAGLCLLIMALLFAAALRRSFARERSYKAELHKRASTDELTGVANRRELLAYLEKRIADARRLGDSLSFAMFDIDNFKRVNDDFGHSVGDDAIKHVVRSAQGTVRINDRIGRMGGEEFGIVLPKSSTDNSYLVCERMRAALRDKPFMMASGEPLPITISTGIATLNAEDDAASLIDRADKALYEAKRSGRDMVKLAA